MEKKERQNAENAWHSFEISGRVSDYLSYKEIKAAEGKAGSEDINASQNEGINSQGTRHW